MFIRVAIGKYMYCAPEVKTTSGAQYRNDTFSQRTRHADAFRKASVRGGSFQHVLSLSRNTPSTCAACPRLLSPKPPDLFATCPLIASSPRPIAVASVRLASLRNSKQHNIIGQSSLVNAFLRICLDSPVFAKYNATSSKDFFSKGTKWRQERRTPLARMLLLPRWGSVWPSHSGESPGRFGRRLIENAEEKFNRHLYDDRVEGHGWVFFPKWRSPSRGFSTLAVHGRSTSRFLD